MLSHRRSPFKSNPNSRRVWMWLLLLLQANPVESRGVSLPPPHRLPYAYVPNRKVIPTDETRIPCFQLAFLACTVHLRGGGDQEDPMDHVLSPTTQEELDAIIASASASPPSDVGNEQSSNNDAPPATGKLVVLHFYSEDDENGHDLLSLYQELSSRTDFRDVVFVKISALDHPDVASKYDVTSTPTFLFLGHQGKVMTEIVGAGLAQATLYDWIKLFASRASSTSDGASDTANND